MYKTLLEPYHVNIARQDKTILDSVFCVSIYEKQLCINKEQDINGRVTPRSFLNRYVFCVAF